MSGGAPGEEHVEARAFDAWQAALLGRCTNDMSSNLALIVWVMLGAGFCAAVSLVLGEELPVVVLRGILGGLVLGAFLSEVTP